MTGAIGTGADRAGGSREPGFYGAVNKGDSGVIVYRTQAKTHVCGENLVLDPNPQGYRGRWVMVEQARIVSTLTAAIPSRSCSLSYTALRIDLCSMSCNGNPLVVMRRGVSKVCGQAGHVRGEYIVGKRYPSPHTVTVT